MTETTEMTETTPSPLLSIGVFSRRSRLSPKALRLYDRLGLLRPSVVDAANGYRWYDEDQLATARLVAMLRRLDMPLELIQEAVQAEDGPRRADTIAAYWTDVERRIASQRELAAHLEAGLRGGGQQDRFAINERDVPQQTVITEQRHIHAPELAQWLATATGRLMTAASELGGPTGAVFVVYHGVVDEDSDGPVEICVPVPADTPLTDRTRIEPAHREAYVTLIKAQVAYPQILSAFDYVASWIETNRHTRTAPPREVYFADWHAAEATDQVVDVAFPLR
jgi:DNA-binding transcriptional MerR regulator